MRVCVCVWVCDKVSDDVMNKDERDEREREREREREEAEREVWRLWILRSDPRETFTDVGQIRIRSANALGISQMLKRNMS